MKERSAWATEFMSLKASQVVNQNGLAQTSTAHAKHGFHDKLSALTNIEFLSLWHASRK
jgi:hypothetical protein